MYKFISLCVWERERQSLCASLCVFIIKSWDYSNTYLCTIIVLPKHSTLLWKVLQTKQEDIVCCFSFLKKWLILPFSNIILLLVWTNHPSIHLLPLWVQVVVAAGKVKAPLDCMTTTTGKFIVCQAACSDVSLRMSDCEMNAWWIGMIRGK